jgi:signal transduction histidine kinase
LLYGIVLTGGRLIASQRQQLQAQLKETEAISAQNVALRQRAVSASSRAIAQAERTLRRIGSDLHDGPAQYMALASLRLDSALPQDGQQNKDAEQVKNSLKQALVEIRTISRGLALPDIDELDIKRLTLRAVQEFGNLSDLETSVKVLCNPKETELDYAQKLCIYRFLQETLANASKHARADMVEISIKCAASSISIAIKDDGLGFEISVALKLRSDGGQGLLGMIDRAESIGGTVDILSQPDIGSTIRLTLPLGAH